jgi:hypothetical protein
MTFQKQYRNFKVFQPSEGSQKHGKLRKIGSREIRNIVENYDLFSYPTGLGNRKSI